MLFSICHKKSGFGIRGMIQKRWIGIEDRKSSKLSALLVKDRCVLYPKIRSDRDQMREIPALCQLKNLDEPHVPMVPSIKIASMIAPLPCPLVKHTQSSKSGCRNTRTISTIDSIEQRSYLKKNQGKKINNRKKLFGIKETNSKARRPRASRPAKPINGSSLFAKNDRAFDAFWRQYITTQNGDHRRHIPLVGNIKQMLSSVFDAAVETDEIDQFNAVLKCFLSRMVGDSKGDDAAALAKHCLSVLASLRSHIFLGHGLMNHVIGDMAEMLRHREPAILNQIDAAKTMSEVQTRIENWSNSILSRGRQEQLQSVVLVSDYGLLDRGEVFEQALAQFRLVVDVLCVDNFSDVQEYKKEARAIVKNLRDSYATDLSDAGHDGLRWFQNKSWCGCHKTMIELIEQPSIDRLKHVLDHVYQIEVGFAERVSSILNGQGLKTTPTLFLMANTKELQQPEYASIRTAFEQLIGRHSSSLSSK